MDNSILGNSYLTNWLSSRTDLKGLGIVFLIFITYAVGFTNSENALSQTTMYRCDPNIGVNVSDVNCLTNETADTYNDSMVAMRNYETK